MDIRQLGHIGPVSALSLGGGGLGQLWGPTSREEAVATAREAIDLGITFLDSAPAYGQGEAEQVLGDAFDGKLPKGVMVSTKCFLGTPPAGTGLERLEASLTKSLGRLKLERVDLFFLHSQICPDTYQFPMPPEKQDRWVTRYSFYLNEVIPAFLKLQQKGLIGHWGLTGTGLPKSVMDALRHEPKPAAVQAITNLMDSPGGIRQYEEPPEPRNIIKTAINNKVAVMGIRAVQAGALTDRMDRPLPADHKDAEDYRKAAPFRDLCKSLGESPATLAHRYALSMSGVDTVILGVKNRDELRDCVAAEKSGPLEPDIVAKIDALCLARQRPRLPIDG